jgi:hypothetical protein
VPSCHHRHRRLLVDRGHKALCPLSTHNSAPGQIHTTSNMTYPGTMARPQVIPPGMTCGLIAAETVRAAATPVPAGRRRRRKRSSSASSGNAVAISGMVYQVRKEATGMARDACNSLGDSGKDVGQKATTTTSTSMVPEKLRKAAAAAERQGGSLVQVNGTWVLRRAPLEAHDTIQSGSASPTSDTRYSTPELRRRLPPLDGLASIKPTAGRGGTRSSTPPRVPPLIRTPPPLHAPGASRGQQAARSTTPPPRTALRSSQAARSTTPPRAGGNADERREVLEKRLVHVRGEASKQAARSTTPPRPALHV